MIITESLDRLSRSQADIAALYERLQFLRPRQKTRRGQIGRIKAGRIPGGRSYGYDVLKDGDDRGRRAINAVRS